MRCPDKEEDDIECDKKGINIVPTIGEVGFWSYGDDPDDKLSKEDPNEGNIKGSSDVKPMKEYKDGIDAAK